MSATEIADFILQSRNTSWDSYPHSGTTYLALSEDKIKNFIGKVNSAGRFRLPDNPREALEKLGFMQDGVPTNAAWLLFAQDDSHYNVHIGRFKTPSMIIADKMISGTLFEVVDEAMQTIVGHLKFAFDIHITGASTKRTEIPEYPLDAIRELLLNSIVHRDYQSPTDVQIKIFDQRIEFFNPSGLYGNITEEMLATDSYKASTRNKQIAEAFYLTKDIEKYGSGFVRIRKELLSYPQMRFFYKDEGYGFTAGFEYGNGTLSGTLSGTLNPSQKEVLNYIGINGGCNASNIIVSLGIPRNTLNKIIRTLTERNLIERRGGKKNGGYWQVRNDQQ